MTNPAIVFPPIPTYYFEHEFQLDRDLGEAPTLLLDHLIDDGAVFFLNGVEVHRFNMPDGPIDASTLALESVRNAERVSDVVIPTAALVPGTNRLSVEVHQSEVTSNDVVLGVELTLREQVTPFIPGMPYTESAEEWIELYNRDAARTVDLSHWRLTDAVEFEFPAGTSLGPGEYLVIAGNADAMRAAYPEVDNIVGSFAGSLSDRNDRLQLIDDFGNPADDVHYFENGRWPEMADGGGGTLQLRDPWADNSKPEAWNASDVSDAAPWQTITYRGVLERDGFTNGVTTRYHEFIFGLLDSGEFLIDDISVIEDPGGSAIQRIQNGSFEQDGIAAAPETWRLGGNHHGVVLMDPDDPQNQVLRVTATGALEDRLNHAETTFVDNAAFRFGTEYEISFRAKWLGGSNQLNTHIYFDRLQRTSCADSPSVLGHSWPRESNGAGQHRTDVRATAAPTGRAGCGAAGDRAGGRGRSARDCGAAVVVLGAGRRFPKCRRCKRRMTAGSRVRSPVSRPRRVVQFFVAGTDTQGAVSYFPAAGPDSRALYKVQDGQARDGQMHNFRIVMTPDDTRFLHLIDECDVERSPGRDRDLQRAGNLLRRGCPAEGVERRPGQCGLPGI